MFDDHFVCVEDGRLSVSVTVSVTRGAEIQCIKTFDWKNLEYRKNNFSSWKVLILIRLVPLYIKLMSQIFTLSSSIYIFF